MTQFSLISLNVSMLSFLPKDELLLRRDSSTPVQNSLKGNQQKFLNLTGRFSSFPVSSCSNSIAFISCIGIPIPLLWLLCEFLYVIKYKYEFLLCYKISVACYPKRDPVLHTRVQKQDPKLKMM